MEAEGSEVEAIFCYIVSSRPTETTGEVVSKKEKGEEKKLENAKLLLKNYLISV